MLFLLYWLNWFIFLNCSSAVLLKYRHLAEALNNHTDVGVGPIVLAHLYKNLHTATLENPLNLSAPGAFWMIQIWLQVYFPELRFPDIILPEDQVMAHSLMSAEVPKRSIEEYLMYRLFDKEPEEEEATIDFRKKFLGVTMPRDMPFGGGTPNYHLGKVYHPNFCARQLGCPQLIPLKSSKSCRCSINKINNSVDALYPSWEPNSCSSTNFDAWWKARFFGLRDASTAVKVLFDTWDAGTVLGESDAKKFIVHLVKGINAQVIEGQAVQSGEVIGKFLNSALIDLELPFGDEEDDHVTLAKPIVEATPAKKNKRKETTHAQDSVAQPESPVSKEP
ncbi:unnamed protein product [Prunus armeniaca]